jgi:HAD superfamily hydrolase (TIGR01549 family)
MTNRKKIKAILFDKDGTLIFMEQVWNPYYRQVLEDLSKISKISLAELALKSRFNLISNQAIKSSFLWTANSSQIIKYLSEISEISLNQVAAIAQKNYKNINYHNSSIKNIEKLFQNLARKIDFLGIATMDSIEQAKKATKSLKVDSYLTYYYGDNSVDNYALKPAPDMVYKFSEDINILPENILVIGDSWLDYEMAKSAEAQFVGVESGNVLKSEWQNLKIKSLRNISELENFLN